MKVDPARAGKLSAWVWRRLLQRLPILFLALHCGVSHAHKPSDSYLSLSPQGNQIAVRWDIALRDLDNELGLDADDDGQLTWGEVRSRQGDIDAFALPKLRIASNKTACPVVRSASGGDQVLHELDHHSDGTYLVLQYAVSCAAPVNGFDIEYRLFAQSDPTHRGILRILSPTVPGAVSATAVLDPENATRHFDLVAPSVLATLRDFVTEGIWHIWLGFDHVLFLLSLLLPAVLVRSKSAAASHWLGVQSMRTAMLDILKTVTAFTVAHSITLTLAVLDLVSLPSRLVESGIALTVLLASANNLRPVLRERRWAAAFLFGLIHGFGFAAALKDLGLSSQAMAVSLFGFNLGVELGQLAIVAVFVPFAFLARNTRSYQFGVFKVGSVMVACIAAFWFVERAFDLDLTRFGA